jgi:hypothetical protein
MNIRKVINRRLRREGGGMNVAADVNAVVSANVGEPGGSVSRTSSRQRTRVVQRSGKTVVSESQPSERLPDEKEGAE